MHVPATRWLATTDAAWRDEYREQHCRRKHAHDALVMTMAIRESV